MITPLVVFITIGSIMNGRVVTRIRNPNAMLHVGFVLFAITCAASSSTHTTPKWLLMALMVAGGIGFVLPNLTVFAQQSRPRASRHRDGVAAVAADGWRDGRHRAHRHARQPDVFERRAQCAVGRPCDAMACAARRSADPDRSRRAGSSELTRAGIMARCCWKRPANRSSARFTGVAMAAVVAVVSVWQCRRVPPIALRHKIEPHVAAD